MKYIRRLFYTAILALCAGLLYTEPTYKKKESFVATDEWQVIEPGQTIPEGLHVRLNLQTGLREAKLLNKGVKSGNKATNLPSIVVTSNTKSNGKEPQVTEKEQKLKAKLMEQGIRDALKNIKSDDVNGEKLTAEELKKKFKSYKELKSDFEKLNMQVKTDYEIIKGLLKEWQNKSNLISFNRKRDILVDLEYYLHQVDNAVNFADQGALESVLLQTLNTSLTLIPLAEQLHAEALLALGAATQSNVRVQINALHAGALPLLLRLASELHRLPVAVAIESNAKHSQQTRDILLSRVVFCLSALCRQFPLAQFRLIELGGLATLRQLYHTPASTDGSHTPQHSLRVLLKVSTFIHDLLTEQRNAQKHAKKDEAAKKQLQLYKKLRLLEHLSDQGWCSAIVNLLDQVLQLQDSSSSSTSSEDHDGREKTLLAMRSLTPVCANTFSSRRASLQQLRNRYRELIASHTEPTGDGFYHRMDRIVSGLLKDLTIKEEL